MSDAIRFDAARVALLVPADGGLAILWLHHAAEEAQVVEERHKLARLRPFACSSRLRRGSFTNANSELMCSMIDADAGWARTRRAMHVLELGTRARVQ